MADFPQKPGYLAAIFINLAVLITTFVFNGLAGAGPNAVFKNSTGDISDKYPLDITPSGWTFSIWGVIYTWQCIWIGYGLSTIWRKGVNGYLYYSPLIMPPALYLSYTLNLTCNIVWLILWDREYMPAALGVIILLVLSLVVCLFLSYRALLLSLPALVRHQLTKEIWWVRWAVQNGIAFYAAWTNIATLINLAIVLAYWADMDQADASTVSLSILTADLVIWFLLDVLLLDKLGTRYTFSPYIVVVWALAGVLDNNYDAGTTNTIFTIVLLVLGSLLLVAKVTIMCLRHFNSKKHVVVSTLDEENKVDLSKY